MEPLTILFLTHVGHLSLEGFPQPGVSHSVTAAADISILKGEWINKLINYETSVSKALLINEIIHIFSEINSANISVILVYVFNKKQMNSTHAKFI